MLETPPPNEAEITYILIFARNTFYDTFPIQIENPSVFGMRLSCPGQRNLGKYFGSPLAAAAMSSKNGSGDVTIARCCTSSFGPWICKERTLSVLLQLRKATLTPLAVRATQCVVLHKAPITIPRPSEDASIPSHVAAQTQWRIEAPPDSLY